MIAAILISARRAAAACFGLTMTLLALATAARADTAVFSASADNTLYESASGNLSNGDGPTMFAGRTNDPTDTHRRALVRFILTGPIPAGSTVVSATLQLTCASSASNGPTSVYRALASWGEGPSNAGLPGDSGAPAQGLDATWTDRFFMLGQPWASAGGDIGPLDGSVATTPIGNLSISGFQMAQQVQSWLQNPASNFGWFLLGDESQPGTVNSFYTRESGSGATLTVQYVPPVVPTLPSTWGSLKAEYH